VRLYELASGDLRKLRGHAVMIMRVSFSHDGRLASAGADGHVRVWRVGFEPGTAPADSAGLRAFLDRVTKAEVDERGDLR
jgi:WD40 repeat protein